MKLYNGYTLKEISKLTGKPYFTCHIYIRRHPDNWTIKGLKQANRKTSAQKHYKDGIRLKERCKNNNIEYQTILYRIKKGTFEVD